MGKGRKENLIPANSRTEEELRQMTRNGGIKSGEARRRKKTMREALEMLMFKTELPEALKERLRAEGIMSDEDMNHQMVITRSLISKAEAGDVQAYQAICAMIGEKPADKVEMSGGQQMELKVRYITASPDDVNFPSSEDEVDV
jgi:ribosome-binding protein aMBF1 (putative translation factor)